MKEKLLHFILLFTLITPWNKISSQDFTVDLLSSFQVEGEFDEGGSEIVTYDSATYRLFSTNGSKGRIDVIDISNPQKPFLADTILIDSIGKGANSLSFKNGILAAAIENKVKTNDGFIVFYNAQGEFLRKFSAGSLPDMVTFSDDGNYLISANEGEPGNGVDPIGGVTIIDLSAGLANATSVNVDFSAYNGLKYHLRNKGVRIFDSVLVSEEPDVYIIPSVAQDLEPEYVAMANDSIAYITLQENNAIAVINIKSAEVLDIMAMGYKDHSKGKPVLTNININEKVNMPALGTPLYNGGETVYLGGFSGLYLDQSQSSEAEYVFYAVPDRGPNADAVAKANIGSKQNARPFKLPDYQSRIVKFVYNKNTQEVELDSANQIYLFRADSATAISGKGNIAGFDEMPVTFIDKDIYKDTVYYDTINQMAYDTLPYDPFGGDFEGILRDNDGNFWMCDEYRPAVYKFNLNGVLIDRFVPDGTSLLGSSPQASGFYGSETLPAVYSKRWANRGFEAIAYNPDSNIIYAFIQSPMYNPSSETKNKSDIIRILGIDATNGTPVSEYVYLLESNAILPFSGGRVDKIGDACFIGNNKFVAIERDSSTPDEKSGKKYIFTVDLKAATNILGSPLSEATSGKTLELYSADDLAAEGIIPVLKTKVTNLPSIGYLASDKSEGIALLPGGGLAIINDNDFGLAGAGITDNTTLGIIEFDNNYALDASDKDDEININNWPVYGTYMPDAIAAYTVNGMSFYLTANEGDDRGEDKRIKDLELDSTYFPDYATLQENEKIGRLGVSSINGDIDGDGKYEYLYSYGARSFSIWDQYGNLVWDGGDDLEQAVALNFPDFFNVSNDDTKFESRSDNKGPEPESVEIFKKNGETFALVGMERMSLVAVYNITNPYEPFMVDMFGNRNFNADLEDEEQRKYMRDIAPEDVLFIPAEGSPTGKDLIALANEVSGTVGLYTFNDASLFNLTVLHNNDGESELLEDDNGYGNVAAFKTLVDALKKEADVNDATSILLSSGDNFLAGPEFSASLNRKDGMPYYDAIAIDSMGYDAVCLGNHDFDFGPDVLSKFIHDVHHSNATYLSANLDFSEEDTLQSLADADRIKAMKVIEKDGEKIGVIGLTTPKISYISSPRNVKIDDALTSVVQEHVDSLTNMGVNKIILISHLQSVKEDSALISTLKNIDIAIAGGGDELLANVPYNNIPNAEVYGTYPLEYKDADNKTTYVITGPGGYKYLGKMNVKFNNEGEIVWVDPLSGPNVVKDYDKNNDLKAYVVDSVLAYTEGLAANVIAHTKVAIDGVKSHVRTMETNEGNLIADALLWQANQLAATFGLDTAAVAIQNGGGIRNNGMVKADTSISELTTFDFLPFPNFNSMVKAVSPATFKEVMENCVSRIEYVDGRYGQFSGFTVLWDTTGTSQVIEDGEITTPGSRVVDITLANGNKIVKDGKIVEDAPTINMATIDFLARGGDQYPLTNNEFVTLGVTYQQALYNYISNVIKDTITTEAYPEGGEGRIAIYENKAPAFTSEPLTMVFEDTNYVYHVAAFDTNDNQLYYNDLILPDWLTFDTVQAVITGIPGNEDVKTHDVTISVYDGFSDTLVKQSFTIQVLNTNDSPELVYPISDQTIDVGESFELAVSDTLFMDRDQGDSLVFSLIMNDNQTFPSWLFFENEKLHGIPEMEASYQFVMMVKDTSMAMASDTFVLHVINTAPVLDNALADQSGVEGEAFEFVLPKNSFSDINNGDSLIFTAKQSDDSDLPEWLVFDGVKFSGTPNVAATYSIKVMATDKSMAAVSDEFELTIDKAIGVNTLFTENMNIYPNPSSGLFTVELNNDSEFGYMVTDISGKYLFGEQNISNNKLEIDMQLFNKGIYFIHFTTSSNIYKTVKLIVQ